MTTWAITFGSYSFNIVDLVIIVLALIGAIAASARGFALEFSSRSGLLLGAVLALVFYRAAAEELVQTIDVSTAIMNPIAFAILFLLGYVGMRLAGSVLGRALDILMLDWLDRTAGFFLGIVEVLIVSAGLIYLLQMQSVVDVSLYVEGSMVYREVLGELIEWVVGVVREVKNV